MAIIAYEEVSQFYFHFYFLVISFNSHFYFLVGRLKVIQRHFEGLPDQSQDSRIRKLVSVLFSLSLSFQALLVSVLFLLSLPFQALLSRTSLLSGHCDFMWAEINLWFANIFLRALNLLGFNAAFCSEI